MARRRLWFALLRALGWTAFALLLLVVVLPLALLTMLRTPAGKAYLKGSVIARLQHELPGLSVQRISGDLSSTLVLHGIELADLDGNPTLFIDALALRYDLSQLRYGTARLQYLRLIGPKLILRKSANGALNLTRLVRATERTGQQPKSTARAPNGRLVIERISVDAGQILLTSSVRPAGPLFVTLDLSASVQLSNHRSTAKISKLKIGLAAAELTAMQLSATLATGFEVRGKKLHSTLDARLQRGQRVFVLHADTSGPLSEQQIRLRLNDQTGGRLTLGGRAGLDERFHIGAYSLLLGVDLDDLSATWDKLPQTKLKLSAQLSGRRMPTDRQGELRFRLDLAPTAAFGVALQKLQMRGRIADGRLVTGRLEAKSSVGRVKLVGSGDEQQLQGEATLALDDLGRLSRWLGPAHGRASATFRLKGSLRRPRVILAAQLEDTAVGGFSAREIKVSGDIRRRGALPDGRLMLVVRRARPFIGDLTLRLDSNPTAPARLRIVGSSAPLLRAGTISTDAELTLADDRSMLQAQMAHHGATIATLDATLKAGQRSLRQGDVATWSAAPLKAQLKLLAPGLALARAMLVPDSPLAALLRPARGSAQVALRRDDQQLFLDLTADLDRLANRSKLGANLALRSSAANSTVQLALRFDGTPLINTKLQLSGGIDPKTLALPDWGRTTFTTNAQIGKISLTPLSRLLGYPRLAGTLHGQLRAWGTPRAPSSDGRVIIDNLALDEQPVGRLALDLLRISPREIATRLQLSHPQSGVLSARAMLNNTKPRRLSVRVQSDQLSIRPLAKLLPELKRVDGRLSFDLQLEGPPSDPQLKGQISLHDGALRLKGTSAIEKIAARIRVQQYRLMLDELRFSAGGGDGSGEGSLELDARLRLKQFSFKLKADKLAFDTTKARGTRFSGTVQAQGRLRDNTLTSDVVVSEAELRVPTIENQRSLHDVAPLPDVVFVDDQGHPIAANNTPSTHGGPRQLGLALTARVDPLFVRSGDIDVESAATLRLTQRPTEMPRIYGEVMLRRGTIRALDNTFNVVRATVLFSGQAEPDPAVDVLLSRTFGSATILVGVTGTARKPQLVLRSEPPIYDRSQIVALLATGRLDPLGGDEQGNRTVALASAISQVLISRLTKRLAPKVGLDIARIRLDQRTDRNTGEKQLRAEAELGKYLTRRLYLAYRRVFGASNDENSNEGLLEFRISARWVLSAVFGDAGVGGLDLGWTYRY
ncbi:MAG: translocation/assembly module TamB domain-containing protein [Deltaproteobacteria bacterium]|nr:translocation/assembly module TamB domain-containing protein [Deltaproteobacteria bacterium]